MLGKVPGNGGTGTGGTEGPVIRPRRGPLRFEPIHIELRDATPVVLRPIRPEDKHRLSEGLERLSNRSRFRRFMAPVTTLSAEQLAYLTEIDYFDHFAWVATLEANPDFGIGVGRYVRLEDDPAIAEAAVTVLDEYQGRGLGTLMVGLLAVTARMAGIERFRAYVLEENEPMLGLLRVLGARAGYDSAGVLTLDIPLRTDPATDEPVAETMRLALSLAERSLAKDVPKRRRGGGARAKPTG